MASGKFSNPRPHREEERKIEQAFRQVTGQEPVSRPPEPVPAPVEADNFDLNIETEAFAEEFPVIPPEAVSDIPEGFPEDLDAVLEPSQDFLDVAMAFGRKALDFFAQNRKAVLVGLCALALVLIVSVMAVLFAGTSNPNQGKILANVYLANINVGGMTKDEAISTVKQATNLTYGGMDMVVDLSGTQIRLSPAQTKVSLDAKAAVNAAYDYGRTGTKAEQQKAYENSLSGKYIIGLLPYLELEEDAIQDVLSDYAQNSERTLTQASYGLEGGLPNLKAENFDPQSPGQTLVLTMGTPGIRFDVSTVFDQILDAYSLHVFEVSAENIDTVSQPDPVDLEAIYKEFYIAPVNATVDMQNYEVIPGVYGYGFDMEAAQKLVDQAQYGDVIRIPMEFIEPELLDSDAFFKDVLGYFDSYCSGDGNRNKNLQLACEALDGLILNPGEDFSFNNVVGQRTAEKGYKMAAAHSGDQFVDAIGGGICQVSSTLYCAAMTADLEILSRSNHDVPLSYMPLGLDAAVSWKSPDFRFRNSSAYPIKLEAEASNGEVSIRILGTEARDYYVKLEYEVTSSSLPVTEKKEFEYDNDEGYKDGDVVREGSPGYYVKTYKVKYDRETNQKISREFEANTQYKSISKIVAVVKPKPTEPEETEATTPSTPETQAPETTEPSTPESEPATSPETQAPPPETQAPPPETQTPPPAESQAPPPPETQAPPPPETQAPPPPETQAPPPEPEQPEQE